MFNYILKTINLKTKKYKFL
ncbi:hypothetical protein HZ326_30150, partial [Fusarium oxysporum f. sp. albedinis]